MKYVRETKAGKSISAWVILRKNGTEVATVQAHFSDAGTVLINIFNYGKGNPDQGNSPTMGTASGYGYDKTTAALSGLSIDGHIITDHCQGRKEPKKSLGVFPKDSKAPKGYRFANWDNEKQGWSSCYRESGLDYLKALGYKVIQAI